MASRWHPTESEAASPRELETMAAVLEGRHGAHAADVADFFVAYHVMSLDAGRSRAWAKVANLVRSREHQRLAAPQVR